MMGWTALLLACAALLFLLPLAPALLEWRLKRDALPLKVVREYDGNIKFFAVRFRQFLAEHFPELMQGAPGPAANSVTTLRGGDVCQLVGPQGKPNFTLDMLSNKACPQLLFGTAALQLGEDMFFEKEVYATEELSGGNNNSFRAILAQGGIRLGDDCAVMRWAHSDGAIALGQRARLYGRVSADGVITLQKLSRFGRMHAPLIRFGSSVPAAPPSAPVRTPLALPEDIIDQTPERWLVAGSLDVPAASSHPGSLVARAHMTVGDFAHIGAGIKSNGNLRIGANVRIDGPVVAAGTLHIGPGCTIKGPIVCEKSVTIATGSVIGQPGRETTVTAAEVRIEEGVLAYGSVWAREVGFVAPANTTTHIDTGIDG